MRKDVKHPFDIQGIEHITDLFFKFDFHEPGDQTTGFSYRAESGDYDLYRVVITTPTPFTILRKMKLVDLITIENIAYLSFDNCIKDESYHYRPFVDESNKEY
jgi:hypothetical protein